MAQQKIIDESIHKLQKHLLDINEEMKKNNDKLLYFDTKITSNNENDIKTKHDNYFKESVITKNNINKNFIKVFSKKK